jgi:hypothetical protein
MSSVADTLDRWRRAKLIWGVSDCIMATCDHVLHRTGIDPAAPWRGSYSDEEGARAIYEAHGGVLALFDYGMALAGFERGDRAHGRPVVADIMGKQIAGVDLGKRCAFITERGCIELPAKVLRSWSI